MAIDLIYSNLQRVYTFLHLVMQMLALWLKIFPDTLLEHFIDGQTNPELGYIDRRAALAQCGYEMIDMLKWLFCRCMRNGVFFAVFLYSL